jgi:hypothetical protein
MATIGAPGLVAPVAVTFTMSASSSRARGRTAVPEAVRRSAERRHGANARFARCSRHAGSITRAGEGHHLALVRDGLMDGMPDAPRSAMRRIGVPLTTPTADDARPFRRTAADAREMSQQLRAQARAEMAKARELRAAAERLRSVDPVRALRRVLG